MNNTINKAIIEDVKVTLTFNGQDVYDASTAPTRFDSPWIRSMTDVPGTGALQIVADDPTGDADAVRVFITSGQIGRAFARLVEMGMTHCNGYPIQDLDNADACTSDLVLQTAVYGEVIYG